MVQRFLIQLNLKEIYNYYIRLKTVYFSHLRLCTGNTLFITQVVNLCWSPGSQQAGLSVPLLRRTEGEKNMKKKKTLMDWGERNLMNEKQCCMQKKPTPSLLVFVKKFGDSLDTVSTAQEYLKHLCNDNTVLTTNAKHITMQLL